MDFSMTRDELKKVSDEMCSKVIEFVAQASDDRESMRETLRESACTFMFASFNPFASDAEQQLDDMIKDISGMLKEGLQKLHSGDFSDVIDIHEL